jgi:hypothetical protein
MYSPLKNEEKLRELILKKNLNSFFQKPSEEKTFNFLINLVKKTRFNEISDLLRTFNGKKNWIKNFSKLNRNFNLIRKYLFHFPIIVSFDFFLENYFLNIDKEDNYSIFLKSLHSLLISKKKYQFIDLLTKGLLIKKNGFKINSSIITIMNHENLFARKDFNGFQSYLDWFYISLEKYFVYNHYKGKIDFSLGKIALIENKKIKAFSSFLEAMEGLDDNDFKTKVIILEWFIFSSLLMKKTKYNNKFSNQTMFLKSRNLFHIKLIYNSIQKYNFALFEYIILHQKKHSIVSTSHYLFMKKNFKILKKKLFRLLSVFIRLSLHQISIKLGVSRKSTEILLSYHTLRGQQKGYFDCTNDTFVVSFKTKSSPKIKTFITISVNLENYLALNSQSKIVVHRIINKKKEKEI